MLGSSGRAKCSEPSSGLVARARARYPLGVTGLLEILLASCCALSARERALAPAPAQGETPAALSAPIAARGKDLVVTAAELETLLLERFAGKPEGLEVLKLHMSTRVLDLLGREAGIEVKEKDIDELWRRLDGQMKEAGEKDGIAVELRKKGLTREEFRTYLRSAILQERLTRRALGLSDDQAVSGDQQEIWLDEEMRRRGLEVLPAPWKDGLVARCGPVVERAEEFGRELRKRLEPESVRTCAWHLLLLRALERKMPDLAPDARGEAVQRELARRRAEVEARADATGAIGAKGVRFEDVLRAGGSSLALLERDPSVHIAALSWLWVDRTYGPAGLKKVFADERPFFDGRHGKAVRTFLYFLVASRRKNELNPRTFEEAEAELARIAQETDSVEDFARQAALHSEDPSTRKNKGELGWIARDDPRCPEPIRYAVFDFLDAGGDLAGGKLLGPLRLETGCALLWLHELREAPSWDQMAPHVHEELRRRLIEEAMRPSDVELQYVP